MKENLYIMRKLCQNFVKFEQAFDLIVPESRRDNKYCKSVN